MGQREEQREVKGTSGVKEGGEGLREGGNADGLETEGVK